jgi:uncharacterized RDD family membrane protein YckC
MTKAGNGKRIAAFIIDFAIVLLAKNILITDKKIPVIATVIFMVYCALMEGSKYQATLGKMALGLEVVNAEGNKIGFKAAFLRNIIRGFSLPIHWVYNIVFLVSSYFAFFTENKQALHDKAAKTFVIESQK